MILNLLPPAYKQELNKKVHWQQWQRAALVLLAVAAIGVGSLYLATAHLQKKSVVLQSRIEALQRRTAATQSENITDITTKLNQSIVSLAQTVTNDRSWASDITRLLAIIPDDVTIQTFSLDSQGTVAIQGVAKTRLSFIALDEALKKTPLLDQVKTSSTPSKRDNLPFSYSAIIKSAPAQ